MGFDLATARATGVAGFAKQAAIGSVLIGGLLAVVGGLLSAAIARRSQTASPLALARRRTRARYVDAPRAHRYYVAAKLATDPVLGEVAALGALGAVVDAGCGRGQLGLCLLELGHLTRLSGFDFDAEKVFVAQAAAHGDADFSAGNLLEARFDSVDTVLLIDVLHYLAPSEQDQVIARACVALRPGGRLVVREADGAPGARSALTRGLERIATLVGYNRLAARQALGFRSLHEIVSEMRAQGLVCEFSAQPSGAQLGNRLVVGRKPA
jgi:SAM-dependent methyltransferase